MWTSFLKPLIFSFSLSQNTNTCYFSGEPRLIQIFVPRMTLVEQNLKDDFSKLVLGSLEIYILYIYLFYQSINWFREGNGNPFQCSCLENPRDGGAWWAAVFGVAQSWTRLKRLSSSSSINWLDLNMLLTIFQVLKRALIVICKLLGTSH